MAGCEDDGMEDSGVGDVVVAVVSVVDGGASGNGTSI